MKKTDVKTLQGEKTTLRRRAERASYDPEEVYAVLDQTFVGHLAYTEEGLGRCLPISYGRDGGTLYLHGGYASHMLKSAEQSGLVSFTVTVLDGLVCAKSAFAHSVNYRCCVVVGSVRVVKDLEEKRRGLKALLEQAAPGRWDEVRPPTRKELGGTQVIAISIDQASVKSRSGESGDKKEDLEAPIWCGVIPRMDMWMEPEASSYAGGSVTPAVRKKVTQVPQFQKSA